MRSIASSSPARAAALVLTVLCAGFLLLPAGSARGQDESLFKPRTGNAPPSSLFGSEGAIKPQVNARLEPADAGPGDEVSLRITVTLPPEAYTYSTNKAFAGGTKIKVTDAKGLASVEEEFQADHPPKVIYEPLFKQKIEKFFDRVTWSRKFRLDSGADPAQASAAVLLDYQVCDNSRCLPLKEKLVVTLAGEVLPPRPAYSTPSLPAGDVAYPTGYEVTPEVGGKPGPATIRVELPQDGAKGGEEITLSVTMKLQPGWHTYSITQAPDQAAAPTVIKVDTLNRLVPVDESFTATAPPEIKEVTVGSRTYRQEVYHDQVTWTRKYRMEGDAGEAVRSYGLAGSIRYQVCTGDNCLLPKTVSFAMGDVPAPAPTSTPVTPGAADPAAPVAAAPVAAASGDSSGGLTAQGLVPFLITAVLAGFAALLTPCVFPMVPITVSFFLKQSEKEHHRPISTALIYCAGIIGTFTVLGLLMAVLFGAAQLNALANNPWLNLAIAAVLVFFGLNLLGMFEIRIPSSLLNWSSGKESQGGVMGVLFMALTFTLVSFTCTFAFVGGLLVVAARGTYLWPILGMLAFSAAFSLPFFFLALFPSYLQRLPRSGGWMNRVKVTMGLIECGAAFKFLSVADLAWNPVPMVFDYALVMSSWMVISLCTGLYLLGMFRLPHDTPSDSVSVGRFIAAGTFLGLAAYLGVGLFSAEKPSGRVWDKIAAFAPPRFEGKESDLGPVLEHDGLEYALDFDRALRAAAETNQPVFLDFTGVNCVNCREMERRMMQPQLRQRLQKFIRVQLYADNVPTITDERLAEALIARNRELQETWFGDVTLPAYAVVTPGQEVLATIKGLQDESVFAEFLDRGLGEWEKRAQNGAATSMARPDDRAATIVPW